MPALKRTAPCTALERRRRSHDAAIGFASPEDIVLQKLVWFRKG